MTGPSGSPGARGRFITFEGGEGAGKSTQIGLLAERLETAGVDFLSTREPGGSAGAEEIRQLLVEGPPDRWDPLTEALLHNAARRDHIRRTIVPALESGRWVLCDRFADSTLAYQGYGHGLEPEVLRQMARLVMGDLMPDLTIVLDVPPEIGLDRATDRHAGDAPPEDRYERMDGAFHCRVADGFRAIAAAEPKRCAVVDASATAESVAAAIRDTVADRLGRTLA